MDRVTVKVVKPRNPMVAASLFRKAGAHGRSMAGQRQKAARALRRELNDCDRQRRSP
jgi:hypothetical protein